MFTVLWDNDGVLVDTEGMYFQSCREVLATVGVDLTVDQFKEISLRRGESTFVLATDRGIAANGVAQLRRLRDQRYAGLLETRSYVVDGAEDALRYMHGRVSMGIVTSAKRQHFETVHATSGLIQYMDFVLTREDYVRTKPHPEPYLTAMQRHSLHPDQCIVVEDSERGLAAASAAGVDCIILLNEWTNDGDFGDALAVIEQIGDVPEVILAHTSAG